MSDSLTPILDNLTWRCIGSPRGGRVVTVVGHRATPHTFYFGAVAGGVRKLPMVVSSADTASTQQSIDAFNAMMGDDLAALNDLIRAADVPAITV